MQTMNAIEELHQCGFLSRDIKPGNFAIGNKETRQHRLIFIFDFGLARRYLDRVSLQLFIYLTQKIMCSVVFDR